MNRTPLTLLQAVEQFEKDLEQREDEDTSKCAYFGHRILTGTKILVIVICLLFVVGYIIIEIICSLLKKHFPKLAENIQSEITFNNYTFA